MPELPEVETTRRGIAPHAVGERVCDVVVRDARLRWPVPAELQTQLPGSLIQSLQRRGKYLLFRTDTGTLIVHLGMSGSLRVLDKPGIAGKHDQQAASLPHWLQRRLQEPERRPSSSPPEWSPESRAHRHRPRHLRRRRSACRQRVRACFVTAWPPTIHRMAGSRPRRSASFTSS